MCHALYIASDKPLPLREWDEENPGFWVGVLHEDDLVVRKQFSLPFVVYAGSFEGCSCGFVYDNEPIGDDELELQYDQQARESVKRLGEYVSNILKDGSVEMFACWEGEQEQEPNQRLVVGLECFNGKEFGFEGIKHFKVTA